jgi:hypothetical protein
MAMVKAALHHASEAVRQAQRASVAISASAIPASPKASPVSTIHGLNRCSRRTAARRSMPSM